MYPNTPVHGLDRYLGLVVLGPALSDVSLAALAYRLNVKAAVTARAIIEPWTISMAAWIFSFVVPRDGLVLAYVVSMIAALVASLVPLFRSYGLPRGWSPHLRHLSRLARQNAPLAGADALEWGSRNVDRFILGLLFAPKIVGIYYMAQQVASIPQKLKTSFDPILGPVITKSLAADDRPAIAAQVRQVAFWIMAAQGGIALMGSIPAEAVMGVVGPEFVAGAAALVFLLTAEALASTGAVCESALVYVARMTNLAISALMLGVQVVLSLLFVSFARSAGWPMHWQAASVAVALMVTVALTSLVKSRVLKAKLGAPVSPWRWPLLWAAIAAAGVGGAFTALPPRFEWAELTIGVPAIAATYLFVLWRTAFEPADRALFGRMPTAEEATLPNLGALTR
jgi:O-antigen/teichoic acid export membrane protein